MYPVCVLWSDNITVNAGTPGSDQGAFSSALVWLNPLTDRRITTCTAHRIRVPDMHATARASRIHLKGDV